jgi:radical SAM protein with 4Fe4S-binding SPASM domain
LSLEKIKNTIRNIPFNNTITITGGEPTLRPDFMKILDLCRNHQSINLQTNGIGITEDICQELKSFNIHVLLTIHSSDKDVYLKTARGPEDGYDKAVQSAKYLTKYNIRFTWQIVVHKLNKDTVIETFRLAKSINPNVTLKFTYPHPMGNAYNKDLLCTLTELKPLIKDVCEEFKDSVYFEMIPFCFLDDENIMMKSKVHEDTLWFNHHNKNVEICQMSKGRIKSKKCGQCIYCNFNCPGIYTEYNEFFGDEELAPVTSRNGQFIAELDRNYMFDKYQLWIFMTTRCNCNCQYCKQDNELSPVQDMTEDNLRYIFDQCVEAYNKGIVKYFNINLSGGEPFLMFNMYSNIVSQYRKCYPNLFSFSSSTNGTLIDDEKIDWIKNNLSGGVFSFDSLDFSKPINSISSSNLQIDIITKLNEAGIKPQSICVYDKQSVDEMLKLAEFAVDHFGQWRTLLATPVHHTKEQILQIIKPVVKYLYERNHYSSKYFDFEGWDLWNKKSISGCPCGRTFLSILPDLQVSPANGENDITIGKFSWNIPELLNHPLNRYYRDDVRPDICKDCELKDECDGSCRLNHGNPEMLKERCEAIKELFVYTQELKYQI